MWNRYDSELEAVEDALHMARGMTYKYAAAGVNHERRRQKVARIFVTMQHLFAGAACDQIPTYLAADRMAEERIRQIATVKKYQEH